MGTDLNIQQEQKPKFNTSVGLQAGYKQLGIDKILIFGPRGEVGFEHNGWHGKAGIGVGTALATDIEVGKNFNFNKTLGVDISANASNTCFLAAKGSSEIVHDYQGTIYSDVENWKPNITEAGAKAMLNYTPTEKVKLGVGVSGQYVRNNAPNHSYTSQHEGAIASTTHHLHKNEFKVSPELSLGFKASKNVAIGVDANLRGGNATVKYTF